MYYRVPPDCYQNSQNNLTVTFSFLATLYPFVFFPLYQPVELFLRLHYHHNSITPIIIRDLGFPQIGAAMAICRSSSPLLAQQPRVERVGNQSGVGHQFPGPRPAHSDGTLRRHFVRHLNKEYQTTNSRSLIQHLPHIYEFNFRSFLKYVNGIFS